MFNQIKIDVIVKPIIDQKIENIISVYINQSIFSLLKDLTIKIFHLFVMTMYINLSPTSQEGPKSLILQN